MKCKSLTFDQSNIINAVKCFAYIVPGFDCKKCPFLIIECGDVLAERGMIEVANLIDSMQQRIEELEKRNAIQTECKQWISVDDALPDDNVLVLLSVGKGVYEAFCRHGKWYWYDNGGVQPVSIPYNACWMPMPEPPEEA